MNRPIDTAEALRKIRRWAEMHGQGVLCDADMANAFLCTVREAPLTAADDCFAELPLTVRSLTLEMLTEFAQRDYYDDRHAYIRDGMTLEERQQYYQQRQHHYRLVGERLLALLRGENAT